MRNLFTACVLLAAMAWPPCALAAVKAAAVIDDGYAGNALNKIMAKYSGNALGAVEAKLYLDSEGRMLDCRALKGDVKALCQAAKSASPFGEPPYGVATSIVLAVWNGSPAHPEKRDQAEKQIKPTAKKSADSQYIAKIRRELRNAMYIPEKTQPGTYHVTARIKCDPEGKILESSILKSSGDALLDKYVLQGIHRAGKVTAPKSGDTFDVAFTLKR